MFSGAMGSLRIFLSVINIEALTMGSIVGSEKERLGYVSKLSFLLQVVKAAKHWCWRL